MKQTIFTIILLSLFILSCNEKPRNKLQKQEITEQAIESKVKLNQLKDDSISIVLSRTLLKAAKALPSDSAALSILL